MNAESIGKILASDAFWFLFCVFYSPNSVDMSDNIMKRTLTKSLKFSIPSD